MSEKELMTLDELENHIADIVYDYGVADAAYTGDGEDDDAPSARGTAAELIRIISDHQRASAWNDFRAMLLSPEAVEAARDAIEAEVYAASHPGGRYSEEGLARAALAALGYAQGTAREGQ